MSLQTWKAQIGDRRHQQQHSKNSVLATIWAVIYLAYNSDPAVVFRVEIAITNVHTIENANVIDFPIPDRERKVMLSLPTKK